MSILGQFQFRRDVAANWTSVNPILLDGELGIESDTDKFKIGDGTTPWNGLMYGGIKGDAGVASQTIVGATTVINPNQNPSVTDADGGPNADLRFSLPRAREVVAQTTNTVSPTTAASVTQAADAEGDVLLTFNIPRGAKGWTPVLVVVSDGERRVLRLIDYIDGEGTKPTIPTDNYVGTTGLTTLANAVDIRGATGATGPAANAFTNVAVSGQNTVSAEVANDTLTITNGTGIDVTTDAANDSITITNSDRGSSQNIFKNVAVSGQTTVVADTNDDTLTLAAGTGITITTDAANDTVTFSSNINVPNAFTNFLIGTSPTPTSLTPDLAADTLSINAGSGISLTADAGTDTFTITNAAPDQTVSLANGTGISVTGTYPSFTVSNTGVTSVNGQTGAITIPANTAVTRTAPTASASTALTTIQSYPVATGEITAGSEYEFYASLRVINTTTGTNAVVTLSVGATNVLVLTQAIGGTAAAAPGAAVELYGRITFYSATAAEAYIRASKQAAAAFDAVANTSASVTVAAATATTIDLKFNTSGATSTFIARIATIRRVK